MAAFRNKNYTTRNYDCTNIVYCEAEENPNPSIWVEEHPKSVEYFVTWHNGQHLYTEDRVRYFGFM